MNIFWASSRIYCLRIRRNIILNSQCTSEVFMGVCIIRLEADGFLKKTDSLVKLAL